MSAVKKVVVDSDSIFAIYNPNDPLNSQSTRTFQQLAVEGFALVYPSSVVFEVISLFQRVLVEPTVTTKLIDLIRGDRLMIHIVDDELLRKSAMIFKPAGSKKNTLVDCSVVAVAKEIKAEGVFSYDKFYEKQGLKLAEDLV